MTDARWIAEEQRLWNAMMYPKRRTISAHSLSKDNPKRAKILAEMERVRQSEFANGWYFFREFINHGRRMPE